MSGDTIGAILITTALIVLLGPVFVWMALDAAQAASEAWIELARCLRRGGRR